jgi:hypothetical protein
MKNEKTAAAEKAAAAKFNTDRLQVLTVPTLDNMPEVVRNAAAAEKQAAEAVKTATAAAEQAQQDINSAIAAGDIAAAQKALKAQGKTAAELDKAKAAHKTAAAELDKAKTENPYKVPSAAEYCLVAAVKLAMDGNALTAASVASYALDLMPADSRPKTPNGTEMTARGVIAVLDALLK